MPNEKSESTANGRVTRHAVKRGQQRGVRPAHRAIVFEHGDRERPAGNGCFRLSISMGRLRWLVSQGVVPAQAADKCSRLVLVTDGAHIITNYKQSL